MLRLRFLIVRSYITLETLEERWAMPQGHKNMRFPDKAQNETMQPAHIPGDRSTVLTIKAGSNGLVRWSVDLNVGGVDGSAVITGICKSINHL